MKEEGIEEGLFKKDRLFVTNLLHQTDFTIEKIATLADVDIAFVDQIRKELDLK